MGKTIHCKKCCGEIVYRSDLIVVQEGLFGVAAYHDSCYGQASKGFKSFIMSEPLNSASGILRLVIFNILLLIMLIQSGQIDLMYLISLPILFYFDFHYFLAWYDYLRHLK